MTNSDNVLVRFVCSLFPKGNLFSLLIFYSRKLGVFTPKVLWTAGKLCGVVILRTNGKETIEVAAYSVWRLLFWNTYATQPAV